MKSLEFILLVCITLSLIGASNCSRGDLSSIFRECLSHCKSINCTTDGLGYQPDRTEINKPTAFERLLHWTCEDECDYQCMWTAVDKFVALGYDVPQFHGKWPFIRMLGVQEPASALFSILNLICHLYYGYQYKRTVRKISPMYTVNMCFNAICLNAWFWSTVFHTRDYPWTEKLDYIFAYSMVLGLFHNMLMRYFNKSPAQIKIVVTVLCALFYLSHVSYLNSGPWDYKYNMHVNILTGILSGVGWIIWSAINIRRRTYTWKMIVFQVLAAATLLLEVYDFPPIYWILDAHALWHLASIPLIPLFYSFAIDDSKQLLRDYGLSYISKND